MTSGASAIKIANQKASIVLLGVLHTTKADVVARAARLTFTAGGRECRLGKNVRTQKLTPPAGAARPLGFRMMKTARRPLRVLFRANEVIPRPVPGGTPLPDVAGHVVEAVAVRGELSDGG